MCPNMRCGLLSYPYYYSSFGTVASRQLDDIGISEGRENWSAYVAPWRVSSSMMSE